MPKPGLAVTLLAGMFAFPVLAEQSIMYRVHQVTDYPSPGRRDFTVWIDGDRRREETHAESRPRTHDYALTNDGGRTWTYVNRAERTFFTSSDGRGSAPYVSSMLFGSPLPLDRESVDRIRFTEVPRGGGEEIAGHGTSRHEAHFSYRIQGRLSGHPIEVTVEGTVVRWAATGLPPVTTRPLRTHVPELDMRLLEWSASLPPAILKEELSLTRTIKGGAPTREHRQILVDQIVASEFEAEVFRVPEGLTHQPPVFGVPGVSAPAPADSGADARPRSAQRRP